MQAESQVESPPEVGRLVSVETPPALMAHWRQIRRLVGQARVCAIATVSPEGAPHLTPIGSVYLERDQPRGWYFEHYPRRLTAHLEADSRLALMAINMGGFFWLSSLARGRFPTPPAVRLSGHAGPRRAARAEEIDWWRRRVKAARWFKGHDLLWGPMLHQPDGPPIQVRDFTIDGFHPVNLGAMTRGSWSGS